MKRSNWRTRLIQGVVLVAAVAVIFSLAAQRGATLTSGAAAPALVLPFVITAGALAGLLTLAALRPPSAAIARPGIGFGAALALGLLLVPKSWEHYGVFLLPAFVALYAALRSEDGAPSRTALALLGASFAVWAFALQSREEYAGLVRRPLSLLLPAKTYALFLLIGLMAWTARRCPDAGGRTS